MKRFILTAKTREELSDQVDAFNNLPEIECFQHRKCYCNWGPEGDHPTFFVHNAYGRDIKTEQTFDEVVAYVQADMDMTVDMINEA